MSAVGYKRSAPTIGKSAPSPPPAPDPVQTANAQGAADINSAIAQGVLNHTSQITPFGTSSFQQSGYTNVDGKDVPQYTQVVTLSPSQQALFQGQSNIQQGLTDIAQQKLGQIPAGPIDLSNLPQVPGAANITQFSNDTSKQLYDAQTALMQPQLERQQELLDSQLANQGIARGSEAYNNAQRDFQTNEDLALGQVAAGATAQGANLAAQLQQEGIAGQNQALNVLETQRNTPINELAALLQGAPAVGMPQFGNLTPTQVQPTDVLGAYGLNQNARNAAYQAQVQNVNSQNAGEAGLASTAILAAAMMSDRRVKKDIVRDGVLPNGIPIYRFRYLWDDKLIRGVMADEVAKIIPEAVIMREDGLAMVDYAKIGWVGSHDAQ